MKATVGGFRALLAMVSLIMTVALAACSGGGGGGGGGGGDTSKPLPLGVLQYPGHFYCGAQLNSQALKFVFSRSMNAEEEIDLSDSDATYSGATFTPTWSKTTLASDTLTLDSEDVGGWGTGSALIKFTVHDADNNELIVWYRPNIFNGTLPTLYYVSADTGDDEVGTGLAANSPFQSIQNALAQGGPSVVLVASATSASSAIAGTKNHDNSDAAYRGYDAGTSGIAMSDGKTLCGGFSPTFAARDPAKYPTYVVNTSTAGGGSSATMVSVFQALVGVSNATALDGFVLVAPGPDTISAYVGGGYAGAIEIVGALQVRNTKMISGRAAFSRLAYVHDTTDGSEPILSNNYITGQPVVNTDAIGVFITEAAPVIDSTYIGSASTRGIYSFNSTKSATVYITNNDIDASPGAGGETDGLLLSEGEYEVRNNVEIFGGGTSGQGGSYAIQIINSPTVLIVNNLLDGGIAQNAIGVGIQTTTATVTIQDNIIIGGKATSEAIGVLDSSPNTLVEHNLIHMNRGDTKSTGIRAANTSTGRVYARNTIVGGSGSENNYGIEIDPNTPGVVVRANVISGCAPTTGYTTPGICVGIHNQGTNTQIVNNTVNGGSGTSGDPSSRAYLEGSTSTGALLKNNIFFTSADGTLGAPGGTCVSVYDSAILNDVLNNDFFSCGGGVYNDQTQGNTFSVTDTIPTFHSGASLSELGNVQDINPGFVRIGSNPGSADSADWHLTSSSPKEVRGGGSGVCSGYLDLDGQEYLPDFTGGAGGKVAMGAYVSPNQALGCP